MPNDAAGLRSFPRRIAGLAVVLAIGLGLLPSALAGSAGAAASAPGSDEPIWAMQQSGDMMAGFKRTRYNEQDGAARQMRAPDGREGLQFQLEPGDQRSEIEPDVPTQREGQVKWYTYSAKLADSFPTDVNTWQVLLQWHHAGSSGSPPIAVEVRGNQLEVAAEGENFQTLGPVRGGDEINLTLRVLFSRDNSKGTVDVWRDGQHALKGFRPPGGTLLDEGNYVKVGYYRDTGIEEFGRLWLQDLRIGDTLESVRVDEDGPARDVPREEDPAVTQPSGTADDSSSTLPWIGAGLLLVLLVIGATLVARRRTRW